LRIAIDRREAIQPAFDALLGVVDQVLAVDGMVVQRAKKRACKVIFQEIRAS